jgi:hypothetical protein
LPLKVLPFRLSTPSSVECVCVPCRAASQY